MSKTLPFTKLSVFLVLCSIYLFSFAHLGAFAYDRFIMADDPFSEGTGIGGIDVSSLSHKEAEDKLKMEVDGWKENQSLILSYMDIQIPLDSSLFDFDLSASMDEAGEGKPSPLVVRIEGLEPYLDSKEVDTNLLDVEGLEQAIRLHASDLLSADETFYLDEFFIQSDSLETISEIEMEDMVWTPGLQQYIDAHPRLEIAGTSSFSLLETAGSEEISGASNQDLTTVASSLYRLVLGTNFEVIERHQGRELPEHIDLGFEAHIDQEQGSDFIFTNPNDEAYFITLKREGDGLILTLTGVEMPYEIIVETRNEETFNPKVIKQYSPYLQSGEVRVTEEGRNGMKVEVWRSFETKNGDVLKEEKVSEDFYLPVYKEEIHSMKDYVIQEPASASLPDNEAGTTVEDTDTTVNAEDNGPTDRTGTEEDESPEDVYQDLPSSEEDPSWSNMK
ncbi:G5 domain-containing protein [Rossellomorea sp. AcN35-11]|nr:VanW family protein [Rossellomorea aquimaris]WJV27881.1 G5 domain-containing protein [Rossellomorea sp. AcN35-11]